MHNTTKQTMKQEQTKGNERIWNQEFKRRWFQMLIKIITIINNHWQLDLGAEWQNEMYTNRAEYGSEAIIGSENEI